MRTSFLLFAVLLAFGCGGGCTGCSGCNKQEPEASERKNPDQVELTLTTLPNNEADNLEVYVNDSKLGKLAKGETKKFYFQAAPSFQNKIKFKKEKVYSSEYEFFAKPKDCITAEALYIMHTVSPDEWEFCYQTIRADDTVKLRLSILPNNEAENLEVRVNNVKLGYITKAEGTKTFHFRNARDGQNKIQFTRKVPVTSTSTQYELSVSSSAEVHANIGFVARTFKDNEWSFEPKIVDEGKTGSVSHFIFEPQLSPRIAKEEVVTGSPGQKLKYTRTHTIDRKIEFSDGSKTTLEAGAKYRFGLVEVSALVRHEISMTETVTLQEREEYKQEVEVTIGDSGTATLRWVNYVKKGKATYTVNGTSKPIFYEFVVKSELIIKDGSR